MKKPEQLAAMKTKGIKGLFFDIDETFTTKGKITPQAFKALFDLKEAGKIVVPLTGRPAGWCDHIARAWPVDAVVGENGAFYYMVKDGRMERHYTGDYNNLPEYRKYLSAIQKEVLERFPEAGIASDQGYREFDLAVDYNEDVPRLNDDAVAGILDIFERYGAKVKISSIHINGWFGDYDKLTAIRRFVEQELDLDLAAENPSFVFVGDSPNDAPLFEFFEKSVGVANVMDFKEKLEVMPAYITKKRSGAGFAELARRLLMY